MKLTREEYDRFMYNCSMWYNRVNLGIRRVELGNPNKCVNVYSDNKKWVMEWLSELKKEFGGTLRYDDDEIDYRDATNRTYYHWFDIKTYRHSGYKSECMVIDARSDFSWRDLEQMMVLIFPNCGGVEILFPEAIEIIDKSK